MSDDAVDKPVTPEPVPLVRKKRGHGPGRRWVKGQSGNPKGPPRGRISAANKLRKQIEEHGDAILAAAIKLAEQGSPLHGKILIERIIPPAKSMPLRDPVELGATPTEQAEAVKRLLAAGGITPDESDALMNAIGAAQAIAAHEQLVQRVERIEAALAAIAAREPGNED